MSRTARGRDPLLFVAVVAVLFGTVARFVNGSALWLDEALSVNIASLGPSEMLDALARDGHPPAYYLLLHAWMSVFGDGDLAVRALSGLLSVLSLPLAYAIGMRRGGSRTALAALALTAMSPFMLHYAVETRMYSLVMLLVLAGWLLVEDLLAGRGRRWTGPAVAAVSAALVLTHYWSFFLLGALWLCLIARSVTERRRGGGDAGERGRLEVLGWSALGTVAFVAWLPRLLDQLGSTGTPWAPPVRPGAGIGVAIQDLMGGQVLESIVGVALFGAVVLLALTATPAGSGSRESGSSLLVDLRTVPGVRDVALVVLVALLAGTGLSWVAGSTFVSRYASIVVPLVVVITAYGAVRVTSRGLQACIVAVLCLFGVVGMVRTATYPRTQMDEIAAEVLRRSQEGDVVLYCPDQLGPAGSRLLGEGLDQVVYPTLGPPQFVDWVDYLDRMEASDPAAVAEAVVERADGRSIFVVANPGYRGVDARCDEVRDALGELRGPGEQLVALAAEEHWESARLTWFRAP